MSILLIKEFILEEKDHEGLMAALKNGDFNLVETLVEDVKSLPTDIEMRLCLSPMGGLGFLSGMLTCLDMILSECTMHMNRDVEHENAIVNSK